jgi:hypothetical protein
LSEEEIFWFEISVCDVEVVHVLETCEDIADSVSGEVRREGGREGEVKRETEGGREGGTERETDTQGEIQRETEAGRERETEREREGRSEDRAVRGGLLFSQTSPRIHCKLFSSQSDQRALLH